MLQYYTLEEAAQLLGTSTEQGKKLLDEHRIKQFRDGRGKVRYVASAVDLLARTLGRGSDAELQLGESPPAKAGNTPQPKKPDQTDPGVFDFSLGGDSSDEIPIGQHPAPRAGDSSRKSGGRSPAPKVGSDSDVRLVADGSDLDFHVSSDSDVRMVEEAGPASSKSGLGLGKGGKKSKADTAGDSDVRMVPAELGSDSDVRMVSDDPADSSLIGLGIQPGKKHSDSDIRLEQQGVRLAGDGSDDSLITEEIDLDAEERKAAAARAKGGKKVRGTAAQPALPAESPFELSESDSQLNVPSLKTGDSSDFDLKPGGSSGEFDLSASEFGGKALSGDEVTLGELAPGAGNSGINIQSPADSGISLEGGDSGSEEIEFELSLDAGSTPKPVKKKAVEEDSDSEFELSLAADSSEEQPALDSSSPTADSDSEFELTLDDSGGLRPLEQDPQQSGEGDIFETDFEVPALEDESGSEAVALDDADTDLESSEFDLALEEGDMASDEESGSQVVALDDEGEVDSAAETVQGRRRKGAAPQRLASDDVGEMLDSDEDDSSLEEDERPSRTAAATAAPADWGSMPALVMVPCVIVMVLAGLMGYELVRGMWGYQQSGKVSGFLTDALARQFGAELPKE